MDMADAVEPVVILGAGPAGIACAWRLAQLGFSPLILEKESFPRDKVCGDALSGKVLSLLRKLGGEELLARLLAEPFVHPVETLEFISERKARVRLHFPPRNGFPQGAVAPRKAFDAWLAAQLPSHVRLLTGYSVQQVRRHPSDQGLWEVQIKGHAPLYARFVVGAEGTTSRVAPHVWAYHRLSRPAVYPSVRAYAEGERPESLELHFRLPFLPGYFWVFPTATGVNVGIGLPDWAAQKRRIALRPALKKLWPNIDQVEGHGIPVSLSYRPLTAPGCALIGDAAALADPFTGEGIGNALLSGIRLAEALTQVPPSAWATTDWEPLYTRPLYRELSQELRLTRFLHRVARHSWVVEGVLRIMGSSPHLTRPLLRWYGAA